MRFTGCISMVALLTLPACTAQEEQVLNAFFAAVQAGDQNALESVSLVPFSGEVDSWEIISMGEETLSAFELPALDDDRSKILSELRLATERNANFAGDSLPLFDEYKKVVMDPEHEFKGELAKFKVEWEERMTRQGELEDDVAALNAQIKELRSVAKLSLSTEVNANFEGDVKAKELQLKVNQDGSEKGYTFQLRRYELVDKERNISPIARWIIADIKEQA